jgi:short-subunit dehydrogenase
MCSHVVFPPAPCPILFSLFLNQIIEPLISKQWFVSMETLAEKALRVVEKGELTIIPERFEKVCGYIFCTFGFISTYFNCNRKLFPF